MQSHQLCTDRESRSQATAFAETAIAKAASANYASTHIKSWADAQHQPAYPGKVVLRKEDVAEPAIKRIKPLSVALKWEAIVAQTSSERFRIEAADFGNGHVLDLLCTHIRVARSETAVGSGHALDLSDLKSSDITLWTAWGGSILLGCGALKRLTDAHGEVKSMHTAHEHRGRGTGSRMLLHIIAEARKAGHMRLSLQTGSWPFFKPAVALYQKHGFVECAPFASYKEDANSTFLTLTLR